LISDENAFRKFEATVVAELNVPFRVNLIPVPTDFLDIAGEQARE
jgi:hypothetical protein